MNVIIVNVTINVTSTIVNVARHVTVSWAWGRHTKIIVVTRS